jgi:hypothetical protein
MIALRTKEVSTGDDAPVPRFANLESRRVVDDPAAVRISSEFRFGGNSGATPAPTVRRGRAC